MNKDNLCVVLVESQGALNIGSVCRAMLNFGFTDLRLVNPQADHLSLEARQMAVKAGHLLDAAKLFGSLEEALADCVMTFGTTRRFGRYRTGLLHPDEAAQQLIPVCDEGRVALVFGREDNGLLMTELDLCQNFITVPTSPELPSMNLAQSVVLHLYEVNRVCGELEGKTHGRKKLATSEQLEGLYQHMRSSLANIGYLNPQNPDHILRSYRRILGRAALDEREVGVLRGLFNQIDVYSGHKGPRQPDEEDHG